MYVAKTIGDISYEERRNSFFVDRNSENQQTVHPIFSNNGFNPETLAKYGWEHLPARFETEDEAKSSPFYQAFLEFTELRNSNESVATLIDGVMLRKLQKAFNPNQTAEYIHTYLKITNTPEHLLELLTARNMIAPSFLRSDYFCNLTDCNLIDYNSSDSNLTDCTESICNLKDSGSFPNKLEVNTVNPDRIYGIIKKGKEIQDSVIFTQNNKFSSAAAVVKLTGRQAYILTPEENQNAFDFDTLHVSELLNCYQNTWKDYITDLFPEELDAHALQTMRAFITETDEHMKIMSDFVNKLSLAITLENKQDPDSTTGSTTGSTTDSTSSRNTNSRNTEKSRKRAATDSSEAISTTHKKLKTETTTISINIANEHYCDLKDIKELKDRVIELKSLYLELLLLEKHIDFYTVKSNKILKELSDDNTTIDKVMLSKTKSKLVNLNKEAKVTCAKIGLLPALWEPLLTRVSSNLAKKYSKEHEALQKDKQFDLLSEHAHQIRSLITKTKLTSGESSLNIEALDLAEPHQIKPEIISGMKLE